MVVLGFTGHDLDPLQLDVRAFEHEPWRLWTSALPHVDLLHLVFNVYWTWTFGARVERRYGSWRTLGLYLLLAAISGAAEHALFVGGVGLSGVGYGLFGLLWVAHRRDATLADAMDPSTIRLFVGWFFFCIVLTVSGILPVANVAHGVGALCGAGIGWAATRSPSHRVAPVAAILVGAVAVLGAAAFLRPWINLSSQGGLALARLGDAALDADRLDEAERRYRAALGVEESDARVWYNLGVTLQRAQRNEEALSAYERALALAAEPSHREAVRGLASYLGWRRLSEERPRDALPYLERAHQLGPEDETVSANLELARSLLSP